MVGKVGRLLLLLVKMMKYEKPSVNTTEEKYMEKSVLTEMFQRRARKYRRWEWQVGNHLLMQLVNKKDQINKNTYIHENTGMHVLSLCMERYTHYRLCTIY